MPICNKCNATFPNHLKIDGKERNLQTRKFCLDCSPFGKHNTKNLVLDQSVRTCPRCKQICPPEDFYTRRNKPGTSVYCKPCTSAQAVERQRKFKEDCVAYKGGKCEICGYNRCIAALEFHHMDPKLKDFSVSSKKFHSLNEVIKAELDKCQLCCATCHREIHWNQYARQDSNLQHLI